MAVLLDIFVVSPSMKHCTLNCGELQLLHFERVKMQALAQAWWAQAVGSEVTCKPFWTALYNPCTEKREKLMTCSEQSTMGLLWILLVMLALSPSVTVVHIGHRRVILLLFCIMLLILHSTHQDCNVMSLMGVYQTIWLRIYAIHYNFLDMPLWEWCMYWSCWFDKDWALFITVVEVHLHVDFRWTLIGVLTSTIKWRALRDVMHCS